MPRTITIVDGSLTLRPSQPDEVHDVFQAVQESVHQLMPWMDWCAPRKRAPQPPGY